MDLSTYLAVNFAIVCSLISGSHVGAQSKQDGTPKKGTLTPSWRTDLRPAIGSDPLGIVLGGRREMMGLPFSAVKFVGNDTIVVTFVTREGEPALAKRNDLGPELPLRLRGIFLDAATGKVKATFSWPTESRYASIVASHDRMFVTERGEVLSLYSADATELKTLRLPPTKWLGWEVNSSPTGRTLLLLPGALLGDPVPWILIDTDNLSIVRSWNDTQSGWVGITDDKIAMTACVWVSDCERKIEVRDLDSDWKPITKLGRMSTPRPKFINDDILFLLSVQTRLMRTTGEIVFEEKAYQGCWWGEGLSSAGGRRLIAPSCKLTGASPGFDLGGTDVLKKILIYDAPFTGLSYVLDLKGPKISDLASIALSPDGRRLAILKGESIEVVELPPLPE